MIINLITLNHRIFSYSISIELFFLSQIKISTWRRGLKNGRDSDYMRRWFGDSIMFLRIWGNSSLKKMCMNPILNGILLYILMKSNSSNRNPGLVKNNLIDISSSNILHFIKKSVSFILQKYFFLTHFKTLDLHIMNFNTTLIALGDWIINEWRLSVSQYHLKFSYSYKSEVFNKIFDSMCAIDPTLHWVSIHIFNFSG